MKSRALPEIQIYTDGAAVPNPGPGGWAAILLGKKMSGGPVEKEITGAEPNTTSIRMELMAAVEALNVLKQPSKVWVYSDSRYLCKGAEEWLPLWKSRAWKSTTGEEVKNLDLWKQLDLLIQKHQVKWQWIKGHADNEMNKRVDQLAHNMIKQPEPPSLTRNGYHLFISVTSSTVGGAWGMVFRSGAEQFEDSGYQADATPNQLELQALIKGIGQNPESANIYVYTKNNYIFSAISHDINTWKERNWFTTSGKPVRNRDLWEKLLDNHDRRRVYWYLVEERKFSELSTAHAVAKKQLDEHTKHKP